MGATIRNIIAVAREFPSMTPAEVRFEAEIRTRSDAFNKWYSDFTELVESEYGLNPKDLPDFDYMDCFVEGMSPEEALEHAIEEGFYE